MNVARSFSLAKTGTPGNMNSPKIVHDNVEFLLQPKSRPEKRAAP